MTTKILDWIKKGGFILTSCCTKDPGHVYMTKKKNVVMPMCHTPITDTHLQYIYRNWGKIQRTKIMTAEITSYKSNPMIAKYIFFFKILAYYWQITLSLSLSHLNNL